MLKNTLIFIGLTNCLVSQVMTFIKFLKEEDNDQNTWFFFIKLEIDLNDEGNMVYKWCTLNVIKSWYYFKYKKKNIFHDEITIFNENLSKFSSIWVMVRTSKTSKYLHTNYLISPSLKVFSSNPYIKELMKLLNLWKQTWSLISERLKFHGQISN